MNIRWLLISTSSEVAPRAFGFAFFFVVVGFGAVVVGFVVVGTVVVGAVVDGAVVVGAVVGGATDVIGALVVAGVVVVVGAAVVGATVVDGAVVLVDGEVSGTTTVGINMVVDDVGGVEVVVVVESCAFAAGTSAPTRAMLLPTRQRAKVLRVTKTFTRDLSGEVNGMEILYVRKALRHDISTSSNPKK